MFRALGRAVLLVHDQDEALTFYRDVLGFEVLHDEEAAGYRYLHIGVPGQSDMGLWLMPDDADCDRRRVGDQTGGAPTFVLYTEDLDRVAKRLRGEGVEVWNERDEPSNRSLHFRDVCGNVLIAAELRAPA